MAIKLVTPMFVTDKPQEPELNADSIVAIKFLEDALVLAKEGKIACVAIVMIGADDSVYNGWSICEKMKPYTMIGALEEIKLRYRDINIEQRK